MSAKSTVPVVKVDKAPLSVFINSSGEKYMIRGLSPMLPEKIKQAVESEWKAAGHALPVCPTYIIPANDVHPEEVHDHDEKSITEGTPEEVKANLSVWTKYVKVKSALEGEYNNRVMKAVFLSVVVTPTDEWRSEMAELGIALPTKGSVKEKYAYVETHVVQGPMDIANLMTKVMRMSGMISEEAEEQAEATFRRSLEDAYVEAGKRTTSERKLAK